MFVYSVKASNLKLFAILLLAVAVVIGLALTGGTVEASAPDASGVDFSGIKTREDRIGFLSSFGIKVNADSEKEEEIIIPETFDRVLLEYNEIQRRQGLDLSKYSHKRVIRYTYTLADSEGAEYVATLFVYRTRIVGCDVSSTDPNGEVRPIVKL